MNSLFIILLTVLNLSAIVLTSISLSIKNDITIVLSLVATSVLFLERILPKIWEMIFGRELFTTQWLGVLSGAASLVFSFFTYGRNVNDDDLYYLLGLSALAILLSAFIGHLLIKEYKINPTNWFISLSKVVLISLAAVFMIVGLVNNKYETYVNDLLFILAATCIVAGFVIYLGYAILILNHPPEDWEDKTISLLCLNNSQDIEKHWEETRWLRVLASGAAVSGVSFLYGVYVDLWGLLSLVTLGIAVVIDHLNVR